MQHNIILYWKSHFFTVRLITDCTKERQTINGSPAISTDHLRWLLANCPTKEAKIQDLFQYPLVPTCSNDDPTLYAPVQHLSKKYCRCSAPDGVAIESSLSWGHQPYCGSRKGCLNEGVNYNDGEVFTSSSCGIWLAYIPFIMQFLWWSYCACSECLNGSIKCIHDFCNTTEGSLSDYQLGLLKSDILHLFNFQRQPILIDLHHIRKKQQGKQQCAYHDDLCPLHCYFYHTNAAFTTRYTDKMLKWKFNHFVQNDNDNLEVSETYHLVAEIVDLIGTKPKNLTSQLRGCMENGSVSEAEWMTYFKTNICDGKI